MGEVYIIVNEGDITFYFSPMTEKWYPDFMINDYEPFKCDHYIAQGHLKKAMALRDDANGQVEIVFVEPPLYS
jgi:hypothetical protein